MLLRFPTRIFLISSILLAAWACQRDPAVAPKSLGQPPAQLAYATSRLTLEMGTGGSSVAPTVSGTTPMSYTLESLPAAGAGLTISTASGVITAGAGLSAGTYNATVTATNATGITAFPNAFTVLVVNTLRPNGLAYSPGVLTLGTGTAGSSAVPTITSPTPVSYALGVAPGTAGISINASNGVITAGAGLLRAPTT